MTIKQERSQYVQEGEDATILKKYVCVECGHPSAALYEKKGISESSRVIALNFCEKCGSIIDPYIEFDMLLIFIDLVLHRTQVWRHLLVNRWPHDSSQLSLLWQCLRLTNGVLFCDAVMHKLLNNWSFLELSQSSIIQFLLIEWFNEMVWKLM